VKSKEIRGQVAPRSALLRRGNLLATVALGCSGRLVLAEYRALISSRQSQWRTLGRVPGGTAGFAPLCCTGVRPQQPTAPPPPHQPPPPGTRQAGGRPFAHPTSHFAPRTSRPGAPAGIYDLRRQQLGVVGVVGMAGFNNGVRSLRFALDLHFALCTLPEAGQRSDLVLRL
jgi:hypothetical protein